VHHLDESGHCLPACADPCARVRRLLSCELVSGQCLAKYLHEGSVARQVDGVRGVSTCTMSRRDVEANKCLACARYAGHEDNGFAAAFLGVCNHGFDRFGRQRKIDRTGVIAGDVVDGVARIQGSRGLNDRRSWGVVALAPCLWSQPRFARRREGESNCVLKSRAVAAEWWPNTIGMGLPPAGISARIRRRTQHREDWRLVTWCVEVLEVKAVIPGLLIVQTLEAGGAYLELDSNHRGRSHKHRIDTSTETWNVELKMDPPLNQLEGAAKYRELLSPGCELLWSKRESMGAR